MKNLKRKKSEKYTFIVSITDVPKNTHDFLDFLEVQNVLQDYFKHGKVKVQTVNV